MAGSWIIDQVSRLAEVCPEQVAIEDSTEGVTTYLDLLSLAHSQARVLSKFGIEKGDLVVLQGELSLNQIVNYLALWSLEAAFCPIQKDVGAEYLDLIFKVTNAKLFISESNIQLLNQPGDCPPSEGLAYSIFSSGSTGRPKCVDVSHSGIETVISQQISLFKIDQSSRVAAILSPSFDASLSDILCALCSGATLVLGKPRTWASSDVFNFLSERRVSVVDIPPSVLKTLSAENVPSSLKTVIIGGEDPDLNTVHSWSQKVRLINVYGPTEATICVSAIICNLDWSPGVIGSPFDGIEFKLERVGDLKREESCGELWISGDVLALRYRGEPELTAQKFPISSGKRWYRTGDLVESLPSGKYRYLSRLDRQFKINGRLVEPREIEVAVNNLLGRECAHYFSVTLDNVQSSALVIEGDPSKINLATIRRYLSSQIPRWMIPKKISILASLPRNSSMKVDYHTLASRFAPDLEREESSLDWRDIVLNYIPEFIEEDGLSFPDYGIDSFTALEISSRFFRQGLSVNPTTILSVRSIAEIFSTVGEIYSDNYKRSSDHLNTEIPSNIKLNKSSGVRVKTKSEKVIVAGANGRVGAQVVSELLSREVDFVGLVRDTSQYRADSRIVHYDPSLPFWGFGIKKFIQLFSDAGVLINCVGEVNGVRPLEELLPVNVNLPLRMARVSSIFTGLKLIHLSTLSVFVDSDRSDLPWFEDDALSKRCNLYGGYAQSKWISDRALYEQSVNGANVAIVRPGLVFPARDKMNFKCNESFVRFIKGLSIVGVVPESYCDARIDITPTEDLANLIVKLALQEKSRGAYHVASPAGVSLCNLIEVMRELGCQIEIVSSSKFKEVVSRGFFDEYSSSMIGAFDSKHNPSSIFKMRAGMFNMERSKEALGRSPVENVSKEDLVNYVKAALAC